MDRKPRVLHSPLNIANDPWCLSRAERLLGVESDLAIIARNFFAPDADIDLGDRSISTLRRNSRKLAFVGHALTYYDLFNYSFGASIVDYRRLRLELLDLKWARRLGKGVVVTFHGCDIRGIRAGGCSICPEGCADLPAMRRRFSVIRQHADVLFVKTPDLLDAVPGAYLLPQAVDISLLEPVPPAMDGSLRFVHAPTSRERKGTDLVVDAFRRLEDDGFDVTLDIVEKTPHHEALLRYRSADVGIGQFHAGWYGVFGIELMALGKPVVSWIDPRYVTAAGLGEVPMVSSHADGLYEALRQICLERSRLADIGLKARHYAAQVHGAQAVARRSIGHYASIDRLKHLDWPGPRDGSVAASVNAGEGE
jgi:glycosyltransferase involved in cell wall biosynthesis